MEGKPLTIMIVDEYPQRRRLLASSLRDHGFKVVESTGDVSFLPDGVQDVQPDVVLLDIDDPSRDALEHIGLMNRRSPRPVVMFTRQQDRRVIEQAVHAGVSAYVVDGLTSASVSSVIDVAIATFKKYQRLEKERDDAQSSLAERKTIEKAKGLLMKQRHISEDEAYAMLRKLAMNRKRKMVDVAHDVIDMAELFSRNDAEAQP